FRDLTGARPFFFALSRNSLIFSNTIQAILYNPDIARRKIDQQFIGSFLIGAPHHDPNRTIYRDIRRLPPGYLLEFSTRGPAVRRIANFPVDELLRFKCDEDAIEQFRFLFKRAIADRLPNGNTSILLSGGLDSTSIAAAVVSQRRQASLEAPLNFWGLCVDFEPLFTDDEAQYASRFAKVFEIPLQLVHSGCVLPFQGWDDSAAALPEPPTDPY